MVRLFCASLSSSPLQRWVLLPGATDVSVRVGAQRSAEPGQPTSVVLTAATSIWLPVAASHAFAFLRDENARSQVRRPRLAARPSGVRPNSGTHHHHHHHLV